MSKMKVNSMEVSDTGESVFNDPNYSADDIEQCEDTTFE